MISDHISAMTLLAGLAVFGLVLAGWVAVIILWRRRHAAQARKIEQRLGLIGEKDPLQGRVLRLWRDGREAVTVVYRAGYWQSLTARPMRALKEAGWTISPAALALRAVGAGAAVMILVCALGGHMLLGAGIVAALAIVFWIWTLQRAAKRAAIFETQLLDALRMASRSLRAGHPLMVAFQLISREIPAPVGALFGEICQQQALGMGLDAAILKVGDESAHADLKLFATSVAIQLRSGGNLADMMERLCTVIRERMRLNRRARVLLAQVQLSKRVLMALPFLLFIVLNVVNPHYMSPLYTTAMGRVLLAAGAALLAVGAWVMNRLAVIRY